MANWVQQILEANPDLAAMPVVKRARHSLHLRRPDGKTLGLFTGAPCHYQDEQGEWQPLDTMPLYDVGRGLWYCPGLNVVVTDTGTVKLGDYSQWTKRIGLFRPSTMELLGTRDVPLGQREGDALVAERDEWRVERRITPTGYRELLTLKVVPNIPQAKAGDFLVLETVIGGITLPNGWVEGEYNPNVEYWSPMPTAWDANNEPLTCRRYWRDGVLYTGIPVTELAHAAYPITIDPDFTGSTADGYIYGRNADYATARSTSYSYDKTSANFICGQQWFSPDNIIQRSFLKFDTSAIGVGQTITQVNLNMTVQTDQSDADFDVQIIKQDWAAQDPLAAANREAAYDNCLAGTQDDSIWRNTAGIATNTNYVSGNLNVTWVEPEGVTYYSLRSDRDKDATEPPGYERIIIYSQEATTEARRPYLTILYEAAGGETFYETLPGVAAGSAVLATMSTRYRTLAAVALGTGVLSRIATWYRTVAATAAGSAGLSKGMFKTLSVTAIPQATVTRAKMFARGLVAIAQGVAALSRLPTYVQSLQATATAQAVVTKTNSFYRGLAASAGGQAAFQKTVSKTLVSTAIGGAGINGVFTASRSLSGVAAGLTALTQVPTYVMSLAGMALGQAVMGQAVLSTGSTFYRTLTGVALGLGAFQKTVFKTLASTALGSAVIMRVSTVSKVLSATAIGVAGMVARKLEWGIARLRSLLKVGK